MSNNLRSTPIHVKGDLLPLESFNIPSHYENDVQGVLIPYGMIQDRIERLAQDILRDSVDGEQLVLLCVLRGAYRFFADLADKLSSLNHARGSKSIPYHVDFIQLSSYKNDSSTGEVAVLSDVKALKRLEGRHVVVVEDIVDTGKSMDKLISLMKPLSLKSLRVVSLLVKDTPLSNGYRPEYYGFVVPNHFVVGYALDFNQNFRDMNHVCLLKDSAIKKYSV